MRVLLPPPGPEPAEVGLAELEAAYAYPADRPWVRANMVASLDGAVAVDGHSAGLSGPADKRVFGVLRDLCDAVLVGAGTVRSEGYAAVTRSEARVERRRARGQTDTPAIAVVSGRLDLDPTGPLFVGARTRTVVVTSEVAARLHGDAFAGVADLVVTPGDRVDIGVAIDALHARGLRRLLCEGGPSLLGQVIAARRLDELCLTLAPLLALGSAGRIATGPGAGAADLRHLASLLEEDGFLFSRWTRG